MQIVNLGIRRQNTWSEISNAFHQNKTQNTTKREKPPANQIADGPKSTVVVQGDVTGWDG
jgi:hypothetical protein